MAINRYNGSSGHMERVPEPGDRAVPAAQAYIRPPSPRGAGGGGSELLGGLERRLGGLLSRLGHMELETEDLILLLIVYLMYREQHDEQLLIIMALLLFG